MKRSINDILNGPIQGQAGIEWAHELQWAVREALKMVFTRDEMIVEYMKERDALQAKLDAVPVWAIALLRHESTDEAWEAWAREEGGESSEALSVVDAWLKRVQP